MGNTYFEHKSLRKHTRVAMGQDGLEANSMIDLVLVKMNMLCYVQDLREVKGVGRGISDYHVVLC